MTKLRFGLAALLLTSALLFLANAFAQTALDPTQSGAYPAYPTYADRSCGHVALTVEQYDGHSAVVRAVTTCAQSGRGSKPKTWLYCTAVSTPDGYTVVVGDRVLVTSWLYGAAAVACPQL
jgi:hypothetical protein